VAVGPDPVDVAIPGQDVSFSRLKHAQAGGDLAALRAAGRRAVLVDPDALVAGVAAWSSRRAT
jgi:hypothetical protein